MYVPMIPQFELYNDDPPHHRERCIRNAGSGLSAELTAENKAPTGALFSVTYVRLQLVTIVFPILTSMAEKSRPQVFIPAGAVKW